MHVYEVLAEPIRRRIVDVLASGEHNAGDIVAIIVHEFGVTRAAVHHHLRLLRDHDIALVAEEWPNHAYRLADDFIPSLRRDAKRLERTWKKRIGWRAPTDPLPKVVRTSARGRRGLGVDPDDPWRHLGA